MELFEDLVWLVWCIVVLYYLHAPSSEERQYRREQKAREDQVKKKYEDHVNAVKKMS